MSVEVAEFLLDLRCFWAIILYFADFSIFLLGLTTKEYLIILDVAEGYFSNLQGLI